MAYQAKRANTYTTDFELVEDDGTVVYSLKVALDAGSMAEKLSKEHMELVRIHGKVEKMNPKKTDLKTMTNAYQELGEAALTIIRSVFGEEQTNIIFEFYHGKYVDIVREVMPFVQSVVLPEVRQIAQQNRKDILQKYNRKTRHSILKGKKWDI